MFIRVLCLVAIIAVALAGDSKVSEWVYPIVLTY